MEIRISTPRKEVPQVRVFDTTLRDGEQTPGVHFDIAQKVAIAQALDVFGVNTIEAGFPASSPGDFKAVQAVCRVVQHAEVAALGRCVPADIEAVIEALGEASSPVVHAVIGVSDIHMQRKLNMTRAQVLRAMESAVRRGVAAGMAVEISFEDASRADPVFVRQCAVQCAAFGANRINIADTVGFATPAEFAFLIADVVRVVPPDVVVSCHCHNDLGMATANTIAAVDAGARQVEVTVNGIGERAGNAALEEVVTAFAVKQIARTGVKLNAIQEISRQVADASHIALQPNKPIVGANAFAHSSGIHQDGIVKDAMTYEAVSPALVGVQGHRFVMTARSGRSALVHEAKSRGISLTSPQIDAAYATFLSEADAACGALPPERVDQIVRQAAQH